ncbi:MAG: hypothetical protein GX221_07480 [Candidatus Riflebacteria bacterium]|nr:hypothetical protein [Candidatus Riflebacteria bacterium]
MKGFSLNNKRRASAVAVAIVFAAILLQLALAYVYITSQTKPQTVQIDESIRLECEARSLTELALLKFFLFTSDYYAAWETGVHHGDWTHSNKFSVDAPEFKIVSSASNSSFNTTPVNAWIATMTLLTDSRYNEEALQIVATAKYTDQMNRPVSKQITGIYSLSREVNSLPDVEMAQ